MIETLNFSGGWQSSTLAWMVLRGDIEIPRHFAVVNADTGDEFPATYEYVNLIESRCRERHVHFLRAEGPKITEDYSFNARLSRIDTIAYWTKDKKRNRGQLMQACTRHYKIRPMRRAVIRWLQRYLCISKRQAQRMDKMSWVGFAADEQSRIKKIKNDSPRWKTRFPLDELGMTKEDCVDYIRSRNLPEPVASVCVGCFAHGLKKLKAMHGSNDGSWQRAVARDNFVRNGLKKYRVNNQVFVSDTLLPLTELAEMSFQLPDRKENAKHQCSSGMCFT